MEDQPNNPMHGVKLEQIVTVLVKYYGYENLAEKVPVNCFISNPSIKSSLKFLRRTPWARAKVEDLTLTSPSPFPHPQGQHLSTFAARASDLTDWTSPG